MLGGQSGLSVCFTLSTDDILLQDLDVTLSRLEQPDSCAAGGVPEPLGRPQLSPSFADTSRWPAAPPPLECGLKPFSDSISKNKRSNIKHYQERNASAAFNFSSSTCKKLTSIGLTVSSTPQHTPLSCLPFKLLAGSAKQADSLQINGRHRVVHQIHDIAVPVFQQGPG